MSEDPRVWPVDGQRVEIFVEPSAAQWFWVRQCAGGFAPPPGQEGLVGWAHQVFTVVPSTNVTPFDLQYQSYLNDVFHRTWLARLGHHACMPLIVVCMVAAGGWPFAVLLAAWWLAWAALERDPVWAVALACTWLAVVSAADAMTAAGLDPWAPMLALSALQAFSHGLEPLPPRVTRSTRWVRVGEYVRERPIRTLHIALQAAFGTLDELVASPRLLPVYVLGALWALGHRREQRAAWWALSERAIASGDPALDYIGIGGGATLRWSGRR